MVNEPLLHLAMVRATQLGPTLRGNGYKAAHATASAALTVCLPHEDRKGWFMSPELGFVKDFNKTSFSGTLGAGLALLQMTAAGYIWGAHWEDCGAPTTGKRPDFVFFRPDYCGSVAVCLVEAKGARSASMPAAQKHWARQIWPNRCETVSLPGFGPVLPTEGRVVVTELGGQHSNRRFRSLVAHGEFSGGGSGQAQTDEMAAQPVEGSLPVLLAAQRANMINVCRLLGMPETAERLRAASPNNAFDRHPLIEREMSDRVRAIPGSARSTTAFVAPFTELPGRRGFASLEASIYCDEAVMDGALRGEAPKLPADPLWVQQSVFDEGRLAFRVQGPDGVGLIVREKQRRD